METLNIIAIPILVAILAGVVAYILQLLNHIKDLEDQLTDAQSLLFKSGEALGKMTKDRDSWEKKATAPMMPDLNPPIIIHKSDLQKVVIKTELDRFPIMIEKAIREGVDKLVDYTAPIVYSEIIEDEHGRKVLYQEIWVGLSEKFNNLKN